MLYNETRLAVKEIQRGQLANKAYELYKAEWCKERGYRIEDTDEEAGFGGELYVCYTEFFNNEFANPEYMKELLSESDFELYMNVVKFVSGRLVSVWDDGIAVCAPCTVNLETHEIEDIGENDYPGNDGELDILQREYVMIGDKNFRVTDSDSYEDAMYQCPNETWLYY